MRWSARYVPLLLARSRARQQPSRKRISRCSRLTRVDSMHRSQLELRPTRKDFEKTRSCERVAPSSTRTRIRGGAWATRSDMRRLSTWRLADAASVSRLEGQTRPCNRRGGGHVAEIPAPCRQDRCEGSGAQPLDLAVRPDFFGRSEADRLVLQHVRVEGQALDASRSEPRPWRSRSQRRIRE